MSERGGATLGLAAVAAGVLSGAPSTAHAVATRRSVLASTRAAGTVLARPTLPRGVLAHIVITSWWTVVLAAVLPRRRTPIWGAAAGLAIGALDLGIARRRLPAIAALPRVPQLLDHVAFGAIVGVVLAGADHPAVSGRSRRSRNAISSTGRRESRVGNGLAG
jgi:hypothetical protein